MNAFDKLVADQIQDRIRERITPQQIDISVPLHVHANTKKTYEQLKETTEETSTVNFILMIRKGNKHSYKSLNVPIMSELAINLKEQEVLERMEKEKVKKLTLDINERLEEEDYQVGDDLLSANTKKFIVVNEGPCFIFLKFLLIVQLKKKKHCNCFFNFYFYKGSA